MVNAPTPWVALEVQRKKRPDVLAERVTPSYPCAHQQGGTLVEEAAEDRPSTGVVLLAPAFGNEAVDGELAFGRSEPEGGGGARGIGEEGKSKAGYDELFRHSRAVSSEPRKSQRREKARRLTVMSESMMKSHLHTTSRCEWKGEEKYESE